MGKFRNIFIAVLFASALCSCEKDIEFIGQYDGEKLVMFSCASAGKPMEVMLSKSTFILSKDNDNSVTAISGAKVSGTCGGRTIEFVESPSIPGHYQSSYVPRAGETIELSASCKGYADVNCSAIVPDAPSFTMDRIRVVSDDGYSRRVMVRCTVHDPAGVRNYYRLKVSKENVTEIEGENVVYVEDMYLTSNDPLFVNSQDEVGVFVGVFEGENEVPDYFDDGLIDGEDYTFELVFTDYRRDLIYYEDENGASYVPVEGYSCRFMLEFSNVSDDLYKYALSLNAYNGFASEILSLFGEPVCVHSNIEGGIGCFGAMNSALEYFDIPE